MKANEVYVEIQLLSKHGLSLRQIAAEVGCAVNTVRRHLALRTVPKYERKIKRPSKVAAHEAYLREPSDGGAAGLDTGERVAPRDRRTWRGSILGNTRRPACCG